MGINMIDSDDLCNIMAKMEDINSIIKLVFSVIYQLGSDKDKFFKRLILDGRLRDRKYIVDVLKYLQPIIEEQIREKIDTAQQVVNNWPISITDGTDVVAFLINVNKDKCIAVLFLCIIPFEVRSEGYEKLQKKLCL